MLVPNRHSSSDSYRYGFGGHENIDEIKGEENHLDFGDYGYDPRTGRRWNIDPMFHFWQSPYSCFNNNPIVFADPSGMVGVPKQREIKKGDTYSGIAKESKGKISVEQLIEWNPGIDPKKLQIGSKINVSNPNRPLKIGSTGQTTTEDISSGTNIEPTNGVVKSIVKDMNLASNYALIGYARRIIKEGTLLTESEVVDDLMEHFASNTGKDFTSPTLSSIMGE